MLARYLKVYRKHIVFFIIIVALIIISSVTKGTTATVTAYAAGGVMLYAGLSFVLWIIKTPTKNDNSEIS